MNRYLKLGAVFLVILLYALLTAISDSGPEIEPNVSIDFERLSNTVHGTIGVIRLCNSGRTTVRIRPLLHHLLDEPYGCGY